MFPSSLFPVSLEITRKSAAALADLASLVPAASPVNLAYLEQVSVQEELAAIDTLLDAGLKPRPIFSARRIHDAGFFRELTQELFTSRNIDSCFIVGGDPAQPTGPFATAKELLESEIFQASPLRTVGLPGFPDDHPALNQPELLDSLKTKVRLVESRGMAAEITTQLCLDPNKMITWVNLVRDAGITCPIRIGIPVPCTPTALLRFCALCRIDADLSTLVEHGWIANPEDTLATPNVFIKALQSVSLGPNIGTHVYPIGPLERSLKWLSLT